MSDHNSYPNRRTILKTIGGIGALGAAGVASAHHVADLKIEGCPSEDVVAGNSFDVKVHFKSGHGSEACFIGAISKDGSNWTQVAKSVQKNLTLGEHRHFQLTATIPEDTDPGDYTYRVSATERPVPGQFCPKPGETSARRSFVKHDDCQISIVPPVEVQDVQFKGCSEVWVAFDKFPVDSITAQVNINGNWQTITINKSELTKIPGHYGHDTPVFKYSVSGNDKLVGLRIVGTTYTNDHRCAQNV